MHGPQAWTAELIGDQTGRTALVTGANTGVGYVVARGLARGGATVVLACRDPRRAADAAARMGEEVPGADVRTVQVDLGSLASVHAAAAAVDGEYGHIDLLINNAGIMGQPRGLTEDGYERHFAVNHLGHFALTGLLLPKLLSRKGSRVVALSSPAHRRAALAFDDLQSSRSYRPMTAYGQSKLADLMFAFELQRRLAAAGAPTTALAAHPGGARTELNRSMPWMFRGKNWGLARPITHSAERGALSILRAATDPAAVGGEYYGPGGRFEFTGDPVRVQPAPQALDEAAARRLWECSEELTGVRYPLATAASAG